VPKVHADRGGETVDPEPTGQAAGAALNYGALHARAGVDMPDPKLAGKRAV
jgi:hypothetical protein